jgi:hypothetical protein
VIYGRFGSHFTFSNGGRIMIGKFSLASATALLGIAAAAQAAPLWNMDFEGQFHVVGSQPNTTPPNTGGVSSNPTFVGSSGNGSVLVQNGFTDTDTSSGLTSKVAVLSRTGSPGSSVMLMQGDPADEVSTGVYTLSFDWIEDSLPAGSSSFFIALTNQVRSKNLSAIFLDLGQDAGNIRSANSVNFGANLGNAARGVAHHLDWVFDLSEPDPTQFSQIYVDGGLIGTYQQRDPIGGVHDGASSFGSFSIGHSVGTGTLAFDNIIVQAGEHVVPEPASALTASIALLGLSVRRRRA